MLDSRMLCKLVLIVSSCLIIALAQEQDVADSTELDKDFSATELLPYDLLNYKGDLRVCVKGTACGWGILKPRSKTDVDYYMRTSCRCPDDLQCMKNNIDVYLMAQVYRCDVYTPPHSTSTSPSSNQSSPNSDQ